jgi:ArsR family transcriptional regulator
VDAKLASLVARRFAVLADPTRLRLLSRMQDCGEASVGELASAVGASHANVSKHLSLMLEQRMVARRREGTRALYRLADPTLIGLCDIVCDSARDQVRALSAVLESGTGP